MEPVAPSTPDLDDAAVEALWSLRNAKNEQLGALTKGPTGPLIVPPTSTGNSSHVHTTIKLGGNPLGALYHNHPPMANSRLDAERSKFSQDDISQAQRLGVPSYIAIGTDVRKYTPGGPTAGEDVLAKIPWDAIKREIMVDIMHRDPNDPLGCMK